MLGRAVSGPLVCATHVADLAHVLLLLLLPLNTHCVPASDISTLLLLLPLPPPPNTHTTQVDATQEADLGTKYGVNGYPTIKWFVDGEVAMDYSGGRDA